jgi:hypothetical protein
VTLGLLAVVWDHRVVRALADRGRHSLALFFWIERRAAAPLVAIEMLARLSVRWATSLH